MRCTTPPPIPASSGLKSNDRPAPHCDARKRAPGRRARRSLGFELGHIETRQFPDGETYLRFITSPEGRSIALVCTLDHPNDKMLPLHFRGGDGARAEGIEGRLDLTLSCLHAAGSPIQAGRSGDVAASRAKLLSEAFDWLVTVDPHLHRYGSLAEIYTIPTRVVHAAPLISQWIKSNVTNPLIIGPDSESEQWVSAVAKDAGGAFHRPGKVRVAEIAMSKSG